MRYSNSGLIVSETRRDRHSCLSMSSLLRGECLSHYPNIKLNPFSLIQLELCPPSPAGAAAIRFANSASFHQQTQLPRWNVNLNPENKTY